MNRKRQASKERKINPNFWVFCEGQTEDAYVRFLRSKYRLPIEINSKIAGCDISKSYINRYKKGKPTHNKDKDFLMYDADVQFIRERLTKIDTAISITSNPCIELWYLLHYKNQTSNITGADCLKELSNRNRNTYKKGVIDIPLKTKLKEKCAEACSRSKGLTLFDNPSTNMHIFIEELEKAKKEKIIIV